MAFILGGVTILNPKKFVHNFVETVAQNELIFGRTTKRYQLRKRQYFLEYQHLTQDKVNSLESLYTPDVPIVFQVTEANLELGPIDVFMDITDRQFVQSGNNWLENLTIGLMELS